MVSALLTVNGLSAGYAGRPVVDRLSLSPCQAGQFIALIGPNAAGKTTLLRALAGLLPATGEAVFGGQDILRISAAERASVLAYMPQSLPARLGLTVLECLLATLHASTGFASEKKVLLDKAFAVLADLGIASLALNQFDRLSGGQRQLVSLAQTLVTRRPLVLLDEPTSALDLRHQIEVMRAIRQRASEGAIAVAVLHDIATAARWADRVVVLHSGQVYGDGRPKDVITDRMLWDVYGVTARVVRSGDDVQLMLDDVADGDRPM